MRISTGSKLTFSTMKVSYDCALVTFQQATLKHFLEIPTQYQLLLCCRHFTGKLTPATLLFNMIKKDIYNLIKYFVFLTLKTNALFLRNFDNFLKTPRVLNNI